MFDKLKNANKLRKVQAEIEKQNEQIHSSKEKAGITVVVNANNKILKIDVEGQEDKLLKDLINGALKDAKKKSEKQLRGKMAELGLGDLL